MKKTFLVVFPLLLCSGVSYGQSLVETVTIPPPDLVKLEIAKLSPKISILTNMEISQDSSFEKGIRDAKIFYSKHSKPAEFTLVTSLLTGPLGLIPAIACSSTPPKTHNLGLPDVALMRDPKYNEGYSQTAFGIKKQKVWRNFKIGFVVSLIPTFFIINRITNND